VKGFVLAMDQYCPLVRAGVEVLGNYPVQPTRLVRSYRSGATTVAFEHSVNADQGALIAAIDITIGNIGGPIIVDICTVDVYARF
jgi:hypothetical protein